MRATLLPLLAALALGGCGPRDTGGRQTVVAAFYPLAWAAEQVGGKEIDVVNLTPPGAEPHDLELTPRQVDEVRDADVVLYLGGGFQPGLEQALEGRDAPSLDVLDDQTLARAPEGEDGLSSDPHIWLDPSRFAEMVTEIGRELDRTEQAERVDARVRGLEEEFKSGLSSCRRHEIVTSHAAFGYLARRYGLQQVPLTGLSPEAEPSPRALERLVDEVEESGATTVFVETLVSPKLAQTVAREAGVTTAMLNPLEGLTDDELAAGEDYISVMRRNLATLREALGCS